MHEHFSQAGLYTSTVGHGLKVPFLAGDQSTSRMSVSNSRMSMGKPGDRSRRKSRDKPLIKLRRVKTVTEKNAQRTKRALQSDQQLGRISPRRKHIKNPGY
jgi:hypothetical protein